MFKNVTAGLVAALALAACGGEGGGGGPTGGVGATGGMSGSVGGTGGISGSAGGSSEQPVEYCRDAEATPGTVQTTVLVTHEASAWWRQLKVNASHVYWLVDGDVQQLMRAPRSGGKPEIIATFDGFGIDEFVVDPDGFVYARDGGGVLRVPQMGGTPERLWELSIGGLWDRQVIASDATHVYTLHLTAACSLQASPIYAVSKDTGEAKRLGEVPCPREIALDSQYVYVSTTGPSLTETKADGSKTVLSGKYPEAKLFRVSKEGGSPELLAEAPYGVVSLQVTDSHIYGLVEERDPLAGGTVVRIPIGGGPVERLGDLGCVNGDEVRVSGGRIYYPNGFLLVRTDLSGSNLATFEIASGFDRSKIHVYDGVLFELNWDGVIQQHVPN